LHEQIRDLQSLLQLKDSEIALKYRLLQAKERENAHARARAQWLEVSLKQAADLEAVRGMSKYSRDSLLRFNTALHVLNLVPRPSQLAHLSCGDQAEFGLEFGSCEQEDSPPPKTPSGGKKADGSAAQTSAVSSGSPKSSRAGRGRGGASETIWRARKKSGPDESPEKASPTELGDAGDVEVETEEKETSPGRRAKPPALVLPAEDDDAQVVASRQGEIQPGAAPESPLGDAAPPLTLPPVVVGAPSAGVQPLQTLRPPPLISAGYPTSGLSAGLMGGAGFGPLASIPLLGAPAPGSSGGWPASPSGPPPCPPPSHPAPAVGGDAAARASGVTAPTEGTVAADPSAPREHLADASRVDACRTALAPAAAPLSVAALGDGSSLAPPAPLEPPSMLPTPPPMTQANFAAPAPLAVGSAPQSTFCMPGCGGWLPGPNAQASPGLLGYAGYASPALPPQQQVPGWMPGTSAGAGLSDIFSPAGMQQQ